MTTEKLLERVREARNCAEAAVKELRSAEDPTRESIGIAFVEADAAADILDDLEKDLVSELARRPALRASCHCDQNATCE